ncbi:alkylation response protein AidB-like acyl-CoA dehydrogenase [Anaerobacterium chartisolvens]|uniref:Alkylation response protein AidB-like acyl-CoA dehydrogenase n=1 Tax=Anaerobacterium chartisolvens TaxID=1297424 RepID=A0A369B457_9FIRM|nr:acyl-CoA dehydrogenase family protein [Anaerobacterium chartisolvens]RCX16332.1 alkylation response protein AidB-like acyl-CoA dehydrogenase [Anaerobacterium chartisolvens]
MYLFNEQENEIKNLIKKFVLENIEPNANERINSRIFPKDILYELGRLGYYGMIINEEYDGINMDAVSCMLVINEISKSDPSIGHILAGLNFGVCFPVQLFGTQQQKNDYLVSSMKKFKIGVLAFNEPDGAGMGQINTIAEEDGDYFIINGVKSMITNASIADYGLIFAKTRDKVTGNERYNIFIIDIKDNNAISLGKEEETMGLQSLKIADIHLSNVRAHKSCILGSDGDGFKIILKSMELMRIANSAVALGIAQRAYDETVNYTKIRKIDALPMIELQNVQFKLADIRTELAVMELSTFYTAQLFDQNPGNVKYYSSISKYFVTEKAKEICDKCLQLFGGYGYIRGYIIERLYRDIRIMTILGGTSEALQSFIAYGITQEDL